MIAQALGHVLSPLVALVVIAGLYVATGVDITNFSISVVSLLLLLVLQGTQNRDGAAIQTKLDALVKASDADNRLIKIDQRSEAEIQAERDQL